MNIYRGTQAQITLSIQKLVWLLSILFLSACSTVKLPSAATTVKSTSAPTTPQKPLPEPAKLDLKTCKTSVSNAPSADALIGKSLVCVNGIKLLVSPAPRACLSSGFGQRGPKLHKGIDYQSKPAGVIISAGEGIIIDVLYREKDFGRWVIIDHGANVYTAYAHLASVFDSIKKGEKVSRGQRLGIMGQSGQAAKAVHLHYEIRKGNYDTGKKWWGMTPLNPFLLPERC
jgi:murein DD-endopeptidase MepM/ murein hydrolase activator NlpD